MFTHGKRIGCKLYVKTRYGNWLELADASQDPLISSKSVFYIRTGAGFFELWNNPPASPM
ncbi:hypothetical protein D3C73_812190 [compost metagenome]